MTVEAETQAEAEQQVRKEMGEQLQTIDPRIEWEEDSEEYTDEGWEYADFTFGVAEEE